MMKRMKRLIPTFACAVAVLVWTCAPVEAKTWGKFVRPGFGPVRLELNTTSTAAVPGAVTVCWLKPGGIVEIELLSAVSAPVDVEIPRRATRVIYAVSLAPGSSMLFKLNQGPLVVEENVTEDTTFVFEIVDAP